MSTAISSGTKTLPAAGSQPVAIATSATAKSMIVYNNTGNSTVYVGGPTITSSIGIPIVAGAYMAVDLGDTGTLYIVGTQNDVVRWTATGGS